jgi:Cys-tRNA(Pro)/Cys-tRNA(Cys) deacylase
MEHPPIGPNAELCTDLRIPYCQPAVVHVSFAAVQKSAPGQGERYGVKRTKAIQMLEAEKVPYDLCKYDSEGFASAVEVARRLNVPPDALFKTLIARGERSGVVMALVPGDATLDLRRLAHVAGDKRVEMVDPSEILRLTGYVRGGVSPLGGRRRYPTFIDRSAFRHPEVCVSAGVRGLQIRVAPEELARLTGATTADIAG